MVRTCAVLFVDGLTGLLHKEQLFYRQLFSMLQHWPMLQHFKIFPQTAAAVLKLC